MSTISALVLLFSYHTSLGSGTATAAGSANPNGSGADEATPAATASGDDGSSTTSGSSGATPTPSATASASSGSSSGTSGTYTGTTAQTRWGPVQVEITVKNGKITKAVAVQYPNGNGRDYEINSYALPRLNSEVVQAQSASIDTISGATVTSDGYLQSLQSAIDQAHLS